VRFMALIWTAELLNGWDFRSVDLKCCAAYGLRILEREILVLNC